MDLGGSLTTPRLAPRLAPRFARQPSRTASTASGVCGVSVACTARDEMRALSALEWGLEQLGRAVGAGDDRAITDAAESIAARLSLYEMVAPGPLRACEIARESGVLAITLAGGERAARDKLAALCAGLPPGAPPPRPFRRYYEAELARARAHVARRAAAAFVRAARALEEARPLARTARRYHALAVEAKKAAAARGRRAALQAAAAVATESPEWSSCKYFVARLVAVLESPAVDDWIVSARGDHLAQVAEDAAAKVFWMRSPGAADGASSGSATVGPARLIACQAVTPGDPL